MDFFFFILDLILDKIKYNYFPTLLCFFIFLLIYNTFSIPGNILFIASSGYFFGVFIGFLISILSLVLGSMIFYIFFSLFFKNFSSSLISKYSNKIIEYTKKSSFEYLIIFRMLPGTPLLIQNLLLSTLNISKTKFFLSSLIGFSPIVFIAVFVGNQLSDLESIKNLSISSIFSVNFFMFISFIIIIISLRVIFKKK